jgi:hypothetical protein
MKAITSPAKNAESNVDFTIRENNHFIRIENSLATFLAVINFVPDGDGPDIIFLFKHLV